MPHSPRPLAKRLTPTVLALLGAICGTTMVGLQPTAAQTAASIDITNFNIPPQGAPGNREAGGARDSKCADISISGMALVPNTFVGLTLKANPNLFAYVPANNAEWVELSIVNDSTGEEVFAGEITLPENTADADYRYKAATVMVPLSDVSDAIALQPGENYLWTLLLVCDDQNRARDIVVNAVVQHVDAAYLNTLPSDTKQQLTNIDSVSSAEKLAIYSTAGLWQDLLTELAALMQTDADTYQPIWSELLVQQDLAPFADVPIYTSTVRPITPTH